MTGEIAGVGDYRITPLLLGELTIPEGTPMAGRTLPVQAFVIAHPDRLVLFDTGFGAEHPPFDEVLSTTRRSLKEALRQNNVEVIDFRAVVNCHLHYDHCGGNPLLPNVPTFVQKREYEARADLNWYLPERVEFGEANLRIVDGKAEVLPGLRVALTPGHTPGHQSLVIDNREGPVILAGQAAYTVAEFESPESEPARGLKTAWDGEAFLESLRYLRSLEPRRVYFSHDSGYWSP